MKKPPIPIESVPEIMPDDAGDKLISDAVEVSGFLTLRRYFVVIPMMETDGEHIYSVSPHYATRQEANEALARLSERFPGAGIASALLAFDPFDPEQMARYAAMSLEAGTRSDLQ